VSGLFGGYFTLKIPSAGVEHRTRSQIRWVLHLPTPWNHLEAAGGASTKSSDALGLLELHERMGGQSNGAAHLLILQFNLCLGSKLILWRPLDDLTSIATSCRIILLIAGAGSRGSCHTM
jgi:hypothetical protein